MILTRVLDWPFPKLGENVVVTLQASEAGDFYNITWPGISGVFNGMAQGRFAAALNQAPMRRHKTGIALDWIRNRMLVNSEYSLPPAHLLRKVFETAANYEEAKILLSTTPISIPVIYILTGINQTEGCVIERLENSYVIRELHNDKVCASNHFESNFNDVGYGWLPREPNSKARLQSACSLAAADIDAGFNWCKAPIANSLSRLALIANAKDGTLSVMGTEGEKPVTYIFNKLVS